MFSMMVLIKDLSIVAPGNGSSIPFEFLSMEWREKLSTAPNMDAHKNVSIKICFKEARNLMQSVRQHLLIRDTLLPGD